MGPCMGPSPSAAVLKVVTHLSNNSGARSCGRSGPGTATGVGIPPHLSNSLILFSTVSKYLITLSTTALLLYQHSLQLGVVVLSM